MAGTIALGTLLTVKVHMHLKVMGRIIQWHIERARARRDKGRIIG